MFAARMLLRSLNFYRNQFTFSMSRMSSVSRTLSFDAYDAYGFDIDHTLAKYNLPHLFTDCYMAMANHLVEEKGYSRELLSFDKDFLMRGLVLDIQRGNFLKLAKDGTILRASHGTKFLSSEEVAQSYGSKCHWQHFETLIDSVNNIGDKFWIFENFFDMPVGLLCARIVDCLDQQAGGRADVYNFWSDAKAAADFIYNPSHYAAGKGMFFPKWKEDTGYYVYQCSSRVKAWLKKLKVSGKKLFVLSSSYNDFACASLRHILGDDWHSYFHVYLSLAKKPSFFTAGRQFRSLEDEQEKEDVSVLEEGKFYTRGNSDILNAFLARITGKDNPKVLFFGDSMRSDICPAKKYANWDTVLVLEEMGDELDGNCDDGPNSQNEENGPVPKKQRKVQYRCTLEREYLTSRQWESLFTDNLLADNGERQCMNTLWGFVIQKYANISIPHLEHVTELPLGHSFSVFSHELTRQWGFYPCVPQALRNRDDISKS